MTMSLVTYTHTTTAPAANLVAQTIRIILQKTTNISQEDIGRLMRGLDSNWIQQIRIYAIDDQMRWHAQLVLEIDRSERQSQLSLLKAVVALDEERPSGDTTAIELNQTANLFLDYLKAYSLGTIWHVVYTQKVNDDPELYATVQRTLGFVRTEPVMWAGQKREANLPFRSELPELLISSSWTANMPSSEESVHRELQTILSIRIIQEPLTAQNLNAIISALTELSTKYWLIAKGRFADLIEYTQTHNDHFAEEAHVVITRGYPKRPEKRFPMEERRSASGARTRRLVYPYGASSVAVSCSQSLGSHMNASVYTGSPGLF